MIRKSCPILVLIFFVFLQCSSSFSSKYTGGAFQGAFRGASEIMKMKPGARFAVLDFTDSSGSFTAYGRVVADETYYRLSTLKGIRIIERQKLSEILHEHELEQAGLVSGKSGKELGKILQADIIVVGSYIFEGEKIRVNGRFTEVETGEIKGTFVYYLEGLYGRGKGIELPDEESENCEAYEKVIEPAQQDLRTPEMIENAVNVAVGIPYTMKCRSIHQDIMTIFKRGGIYPERYKQFLRDTVISIKNPEEQERKTSVFYYFQSDKKIDEMEWNTGILAMKNSNEWVIRRIVRFILNRCERQDEDLLRKRIDTLISLAGDRAFGRPRIISQPTMFETIFRTGPPNEITRNIRLYLLDKYSEKHLSGKRGLSLVLRFSEKSLVSEKDKTSRTRFYEHLSRILSAAPRDDISLAYQLCGFIREIHYRYYKTDKEELNRFTRSLAPWLCYAASQVRRDYRLRSAIGILQSYKIECGK